MTRIGRKVYIKGLIALLSKGTAIDQARIINEIPYNHLNVGTGQFGSQFTVNSTAELTYPGTSSIIADQIEAATSNILLFGYGSNIAQVGVSDTNFSNTTQSIFSGFYSTP